jgi:hypothetical protein
MSEETDWDDTTGDAVRNALNKYGQLLKELTELESDRRAELSLAWRKLRDCDARRAWLELKLMNIPQPPTDKRSPLRKYIDALLDRFCP